MANNKIKELDDKISEFAKEVGIEIKKIAEAGGGGGIGIPGKSAYDVWKELPGNENKTVEEFFADLKGEDGKTAFEVWKEIPGNENKTLAEFIAALKGVKGDDGKSAFEVWKAIPGNENKTLDEYLEAIKGDPNEGFMLNPKFKIEVPSADINNPKTYEEYANLPENASKFPDIPIDFIPISLGVNENENLDFVLRTNIGYGRGFKGSGVYDVLRCVGISSGKSPSELNYTATLKFKDKKGVTYLIKYTLIETVGTVTNWVFKSIVVMLGEVIPIIIKKDSSGNYPNLKRKDFISLNENGDWENLDDFKIPEVYYFVDGPLIKCVNIEARYEGLNQIIVDFTFIIYKPLALYVKFFTYVTEIGNYDVLVFFSEKNKHINYTP